MEGEERMKYKFLELRAFNESPHETSAYYCTVMMSMDMAEEQMLESLVRPMFHAVFDKIIPEPQPDPLLDMDAFMAWTEKWHGVGHDA
jgi:hypothetical protein